MSTRATDAQARPLPLVEEQQASVIEMVEAEAVAGKWDGREWRAMMAGRHFAD